MDIKNVIDELKQELGSHMKASIFCGFSYSRYLQFIKDPDKIPERAQYILRKSLREAWEVRVGSLTSKIEEVQEKINQIR